MPPLDPPVFNIKTIHCIKAKIFQALEMLLDILRTNLTSNWGGYIIPTNENEDQVSFYAYCLYVSVHKVRGGKPGRIQV